MTWRDEHEVTTTYGLIQLSLEQSHAAGVKTERERIIKLLEDNLEGVLRFSNANIKTPTSPEIVMSSFTGDIIALIKGEN